MRGCTERSADCERQISHCSTYQWASIEVEVLGLGHKRKDDVLFTRAVADLIIARGLYFIVCSVLFTFYSFIIDCGKRNGPKEKMYKTQQAKNI